VTTIGSLLKSIGADPILAAGSGADIGPARDSRKNPDDGAHRQR
jgi:hypothetical protein